MKIFAASALLAQGWQTDVTVSINDNGTIDSVVANSTAPPGANGTAVDVLLPAPANLHSHAFQRAMAGMTEQRGPNPSDSFWTWRQLMYRFLDHLTPDDIESIAALVQMEMLEAGYAAVGEFHYIHHQSSGQPYRNTAELCDRIAAAAADTGIGLTLLPVLYEHGGCDGRALGHGQRRFGCDLALFEKLFAGARHSISALPADSVLGVAPHSLRAVSRESLAHAATLAPTSPFHLHIAEQPLEVEEVSAAWGLRPVEWLLDNHDVDHRWCLIHCTQMLSTEVTALAHSGAVVGLCPITESSLGDGIFSASDFLNAGGRIGIGSDSNIRISLTEEMRTLEYSQRLRDKGRAILATARHSTGRRIFDQIVKSGALACQRNAGEIASGQLADLFALDTDNVFLAGSRADQIIDHHVFAGADSAVSQVWSAGRHVVVDGRHINRARICKRYRNTLAALQQRL